MRKRGAATEWRGPEGRPRKCRERLSIGDNFGDNSSTHRCQKKGWHAEHRERWRDINGNDVVMTWRRRAGFYWRWVCVHEGCDWQDSRMFHSVEEKLRTVLTALRRGASYSDGDLELIEDRKVHVPDPDRPRNRNLQRHAYVMATFEVRSYAFLSEVRR